MAINFDELPKTNDSARTLFEKGIYKLKVKAAYIPEGKEYLTVQFTATDNTGKSTSVFNSFFDSDKPLPRYMLAQFIRATKLPLTGNFELRDLPKIVINKELRGAIKIEQTEGYQPKNVIDAFDDEIFYPAEAQGTTNPPVNGDVPFDVTPPTGGAEY